MGLIDPRMPGNVCAPPAGAATSWGETMKHHKSRGGSCLLALTLLTGTPAAAAVLAVPASAQAAPAGGTAPAGRYSLDTAGIWTAQTVLLTETSLVDPDTDRTAVRREVTWGDGSAPQVIAAGARSVRHRYTRAGTFAVSVRLSDDTANQVRGVVAGTSSVRVTATPGTYRLDRSTAWTYRVVNKQGTAWQESPAVPLTLTMAGIPTNVSRIRVDWGEGVERLYPRTAKKAVLRYYSGPAHRVTVSLENANGRSAVRPVGTFKVTLDTFDPTLSITKPANADRVASWRTITGKASDRGVGVRTVMVSLVQWRGSSIYYYTGSVWRKASSPGDAAKRAANVRAAYAKGSWKLAVKGMAKGDLQVAAYAEEPGGMWSGWKYRDQNITR
jgi:5'-nucleotidase